MIPANELMCKTVNSQRLLINQLGIDMNYIIVF